MGDRMIGDVTLAVTHLPGILEAIVRLKELSRIAYSYGGPTEEIEKTIERLQQDVEQIVSLAGFETDPDVAFWSYDGVIYPIRIVERGSGLDFTFRRADVEVGRATTVVVRQSYTHDDDTRTPRYESDRGKLVSDPSAVIQRYWSKK